MTANLPQTRFIATNCQCSYEHCCKQVLDREMSVHALYVTAAYAITAVALAGLIGWILLDQRARRRDLAELEASGVRRRSDKAGKS